MKYTVTTLRLTEKDIADHEEIEQSLQGAKLSHHTIYRKGLDCLKEQMPIRIIKVDLTKQASSV